MFWDAWNKWPSGTQFPFSCYGQWATLVVQDLEGPGHFLQSKDGATQGDPLDMIIYGIGVLPLIQELWDAQPCVTHPWYADDAVAGGNFE